MDHLLLDHKKNGSKEDSKNPPGIVISARWQELVPAVSAFIWGGKVRPVPALPYGRQGV